MFRTVLLLFMFYQFLNSILDNCDKNSFFSSESDSESGEHVKIVTDNLSHCYSYTCYFTDRSPFPTHTHMHNLLISTCMHTVCVYTTFFTVNLFLCLVVWFEVLFIHF